MRVRVRNVCMPSWLACREDVLPEDKMVMSVILAYQKGVEGRCLLTQREIGKRWGMSRKAVNLAIARLTCTEARRNNGRGERRRETTYRRVMVEKLDRRLATGILQPCYRVSFEQDTAAWWMQEEWAGRSGIGDLRTRYWERAEERRRRLVAFPVERSEALRGEG